MRPLLMIFLAGLALADENVVVNVFQLDVVGCGKPTCRKIYRVRSAFCGKKVGYDIADDKLHWKFHDFDEDYTEYARCCEEKGYAFCPARSVDLKSKS